jgi:hypothetical protein
MTDNELRELVAKTALSVQTFSEERSKTEQLIRQLSEEQLKTDEQLKRTDEQLRQTDEQLKQTDEQLRRLSKKTETSIDRLSEEIRTLSKETDKKIKEVSKQIGGLGNKFGSFTEGLALPSMEKILSKHFKMDYIFPRAKSKLLEEELEIDVLAYSNGKTNEVYVVEVKSHLTMRELEQTLRTLNKFPQAFPEHANKTLYGMIVAVDASSEMKQRVLKEGLYFATIHDDHFQLKTPSHFVPKKFNVL